jgi:hypothetical protein
MKRTLRRLLLVSLLATIVYQGVLASKKVEIYLALQELRQAGFPVAAHEVSSSRSLRSNAAALYDAAGQLALDLPSFGYSQADKAFLQEQPEVAQTILSGSHSTLLMLAEASQRPACEFGPDQINYLGHRQMVSVACLNMLDLGAKGDLQAAEQIGQQLAQLMQRLCNGRGLVNHSLARTLSDQLALTVQEVRADAPGHRQLLSTEMRQLADVLDRNLVLALRDERATGLGYFQEAREGDWSFWPVNESNFVVFELLVVNDQLVFLDRLEKLDNALRQGLKSDDQLAGLCAINETTYPLSYSLLSYLPRLAERHRETVAKLRAL